MARNFLGDIPGNFFVSVLGTHAAVASNGNATRMVDPVFVAPANIKILSVWRQNQGTAEAANSQATRYRDFKLFNGGTSGTGTVVIASIRSGTAVGPIAYATQSLAITTDNTVTQGAILWCSALASIGAASDDSTALIASVVEIAYELL